MVSLVCRSVEWVCVANNHLRSIEWAIKGPRAIGVCDKFTSQLAAILCVVVEKRFVIRVNMIITTSQPESLELRVQVRQITPFTRLLAS